jgi:hypothetical protein
MTTRNRFESVLAVAAFFTLSTAMPTLFPEQNEKPIIRRVPKIRRLLPIGISVISGPSGGGKSMLASAFAWRWLRARSVDGKRHGHVLANYVVELVLPDGSVDDTKRPERFHLVQGWSECFCVASEILMADPKADLLVQVDEAASSFSSRSWQSDVAAILSSSITLKRKWRMHLQFITMNKSLLLRVLRETGETGGLLDWEFSKELYQIQRYGGHLLARGYSPKEIFVVIGRTEEPRAFAFTFQKGLAIPRSEAKAGDYIYDTMSQSVWSTGPHPTAPKGEWQWSQFLAVQSGIAGDKIPSMMYRYWHDPGGPRKLLIERGIIPPDAHEPKPTPEANAPVVPVEVSSAEPSAEEKRVRRVEELLLARGANTNQSAIAREVGCSQPFVSETLKRLRKEGRLL